MSFGALRHVHDQLPITKPVRVGGYPLEHFEGPKGFEKLTQVYRLCVEETLRRVPSSVVAYLHLRRDPFTSALDDGLYEMHVLESDMPMDIVMSTFLVVAKIYGALGESRGSALYTLVEAEVVREGKNGAIETKEAEVVLLNLWTPLAQCSYSGYAQPCERHGYHVRSFKRANDPEGPGLLSPMDRHDVEIALRDLARAGGDQ